MDKIILIVFSVFLVGGPQATCTPAGISFVPTLWMVDSGVDKYPNSSVDVLRVSIYNILLYLYHLGYVVDIFILWLLSELHFYFLIYTYSLS